MKKTNIFRTFCNLKISLENGGGAAKSSHGENCVRIFDQPILLCYCACHKIPSFLQVLPNADDDEVVAVEGEHEEVNSKNEDFVLANSHIFQCK